MTEDTEELPSWAPRVQQRKIRQLYEDDAKGIRDEELIEDVGYSLLFRCESFIAANGAAREGRAPCARCGQIVEHSRGKDEVLECCCGWRLPGKRYFKTIQHKQLSGGEDVMGPFREYVDAFKKTKDPRQRMILIDQLIHGFHGYIKEMRVRRPVGVNLIGGSMNQVVRFLDDLSDTGYSTPELSSTHALWRRGIDSNKNWYPGIE